MITCGHHTYFSTILKFNRICSARNGLVFYLYSDQFACDSIRFLSSKSLFPDEFFFLQFAEHAKSGHNRGNLSTQLVSIKRKPGLETKSITATKSARRYTCIQKHLPYLLSPFDGSVYFKTVFTCISSPADNHSLSFPGALKIRIKSQFRGVFASKYIDNCLFSLRPLNGNLTPFGRLIIHFHIEAFDLIHNPSIVLIDIGSIDH